jgi:peptidyl-prolyl cis-trans isomerase B (cyclophilin B)
VRSGPRSWLALAALVGAIAGGCGDDEEETPSAATEAAAGTACEDVEEPAPKNVELSRPGRLEPPPQGTVATVETSCGNFEIELDVERAPRTTASFAYLVEEGVYGGTAFHRIVPGFVIQGGDPAGDGTGGPGYFVDEPPPKNVSYTRGTVAMAKSPVEPPGRSGSQFFVVTGADAGLPADYALLGKLASGQEVVKRIEELGDPGAGEAGTPTRPVVIERVTLTEPR